ncbi:cob(I)yrinic acid a,c-diamide adenosyltransferase [Amycolatopsis anabasis]|uniref:cob(I)yrinic acid a,c-diamide adenosyltransferase n=1 Tax=Amycolatopsis anabasis TaxID=1840409 RepID=UPI00131B03AC|nr:cob(I)yrinic acid a,c-diamide adenosyltransferase [Amycolatopsis anabasis]
MKVYTRKGDTGETGIWGGKRIGKDEARMEAIGTVDECNAAIGLAATGDLPPEVAEVLATVQNTLFVVGSELMAPERTGSGASVPRLTGDETSHLETVIDELDGRNPELKNFILPGGTVAAAQLHVARAVCRRAERRVAALTRAEAEGVSPDVPAYLNRLADLLFVVARYVNHVAGVPDVPWAPRG